ncbi:MAG: ATP-grasp domain-containing protein [Cellvibrionaceae bacterium]|nr:ATP-grasp domain-containing protein [Cellvibrionaceae bacterium]
MRILMSAATSPAGASIVRHLQALGHFVIGMDANPHTVEYGRELCDEFAPAPLVSNPEFISFLHSLAPTFDIFIPFLDEELRLFAAGKISREVVQKTLLCNPDVLDFCLDKTRFQEFCLARGLPVAKTASGPPAVYKPSFGRGGKGVVTIEDAELFAYYSRKDGILQERIKGTEYTVDVLFDQNGNLIFAVPRKRLEAAGVSRIGEIDFNAQVLQAVEQCAQHFRFSYAINVQLMLDAEGRVHLLEINPRLAGSAIFSVMAGFDIFDLALRLFAGASIEPPRRESVRPLRIVRHWTEVMVNADRVF